MKTKLLKLYFAFKTALKDVTATFIADMNTLYQKIEKSFYKRNKKQKSMPIKSIDDWLKPHPMFYFRVWNKKGYIFNAVLILIFLLIILRII